MIKDMEVEQHQLEQEPTTPRDTAPAYADLSRTVSEQPRSVGVASPPSADDSATVGVATANPPKSFSFQPQKHTLDLRQILVRFKAAGIERTPRAIQRYCKQGKLDAYMHPTQKVYLVTQESVEKLIASIKEVDERHNDLLFREEATGETDSKAPVSEYAQNRREPSAKSREPSPSLSHETPRTDATSERIRQLEEKNQSLEIDKRVRDQLIDQLKQQIRDDRKHFTEKLTGFARLAGYFQAKAKLLVAPKESRGVEPGIEDLDTIEASILRSSDAFNSDLEADEENV